MPAGGDGLSAEPALGNVAPHRVIGHAELVSNLPSRLPLACHAASVTNGEPPSSEGRTGDPGLAARAAFAGVAGGAATAVASGDPDGCNGAATSAAGSNPSGIGLGIVGSSDSMG